MQLCIQNISKNYGKKTALRDVSMTLTPGIYGLLGPNGAGKSTLMNILVNLLSPSNGIVTCNGQEITRMDGAYRKLLGYLPQNVGMYKNFTGLDMLIYFAALKGIDKQHALTMAEEILKAVNLSEDSHRLIKQYSGGMKQRLGIAQALIGDPKILIFDEPTAGLDPKERIRFMNLLSEIASDKIIILATHIVSDVEQIAGYLIFLKDGQIIEQNTPDQCLQKITGKVWTAVISHAEYRELSGRAAISKVTNDHESLHVRILSDTPPVETAISSDPILEDVYIHLFGETEYENFS